MQVFHSKASCGFMSFATVVIGALLYLLLTRYLLRDLTSRKKNSLNSLWMWQSTDGLVSSRVKAVKPDFPNERLAEKFDQTLSPFIIPHEADETGFVYSQKLPPGDVPYKTISFYDPKAELQFLLKTDFSKCEYSKCSMTRQKENADAVIFLSAKLTRVGKPTFRRKPGQIWIMKTDEAPSRFTWFESLNKTDYRELFNWTLTFKLNSDIRVQYGFLIEKQTLPVKDYDKIYDGKTKTAAWFVSHCPVRSNRSNYVSRMQKRTDVDIFGLCGTLTCGMAQKVPGVVKLRQLADQEICFPMMSKLYKFYLAFENSLCQEYISEKFFKIFHDVDVVPVVRGGADYKRYFPSNMFVDASDFSTPEALADYLVDLGNDKQRYIRYLKNKNRWRSVIDFPEWQCKLCRKLHIDTSTKTYSNVHEWWVNNSCHDDCVDSPHFM